MIDLINYRKMKKGDIFYLICCLIVLIAMYANTFLTVFDTQRFERVFISLRENNEINSHFAQIESIHYDPLILPRQSLGKNLSGIYYIKENSRIQTTSVVFSSQDSSIEKIYIKDGIFSYKQIYPPKNGQLGNILSISWITSYVIMFFAYLTLRLLLAVFPDFFVKLIKLPEKVIKSGKFNGTVYPFILFCDGMLLLIVFNFLRFLYVL